MYFLLMTVLLSGTNLVDSVDTNQEYQKNTFTHFLSDTLEYPFNKVKPDTNLIVMPVYKPPLLDNDMPVLKPPPDMEFNMPVIGSKNEKSQMPFFYSPDSTENPLKKRPSGINRND